MIPEFENHSVDVEKCDECWSSADIKCNQCGGIKHSRFVDEILNEDGDEFVLLAFWCERCGNTEAPY